MVKSKQQFEDELLIGEKFLIHIEDFGNSNNLQSNLEKTISNLNNKELFNKWALIPLLHNSLALVTSVHVPLTFHPLVFIEYAKAVPTYPKPNMKTLLLLLSLKLESSSSPLLVSKLDRLLLRFLYIK